MSELNRPDPDALLVSIQKSETVRKRGLLKIFFGMAAGVGKTYAMLEAARALRNRGKEVVVGIVETHGRAETEALLEGLPVIPRRVIDYRETPLREMDLDEIIRRRPEWVLIDELAHTNVEGSRHRKRYQDVLEALENGINVFTTLNVQHVESLVDTVQQISGITVRETVPDNIIDGADEIELIDLPPDDLLRRLAEGKVYAPDRSAAAADNFFRKGNLTALREIALRRTAQRVDLQLKEYMQEHRISGPWRSSERLMVAIGPSPYSEQLIRWTKRIAATMESPWVAVYVQPTKPMEADDERRLKKNIALARELGADLVTTVDNDIVKALIRTARENNVTQIVVGKSRTNSYRDALHGGSLVNRLIAESGGIDIYVVQSDTAEPKRPSARFTFFSPQSTLRHYLFAGGCAAGAAAGCLIASPYIDYRSVGMFFLFVISLLSLFAGRGPVLAAAGLSAVLWDFLFIPPQFTFSISHPSDILMVLSFFIVAIVTGTLTSRVREQEAAVRRREEYASALYALVKELSCAESVDEVAAIAAAHIRSVFASDIACFFTASSTDLASVPHTASTFKPDSTKEWSVADWVFKNRKPAGRGTATLPFAQAHYFPLMSSGGCLGVIGLSSHDRGELDFENEGLLTMYLHQISLAIDRIHLRSDRFSKTLLNSISHELRTPLSTITGASSGLADPATTANPVARDLLLGDIRSAAARLNRLVENLLDMSRLESGAVTLATDWCDVHDLFNAVLADLKEDLRGHTVTVDIQPDMPFVKVDTVLIEQALSNIVLNAAQYTPDRTTIFLRAYAEDSAVVFTIDDQGPGFAPESLDRLFDKFYRAPGVRSGGTGLGLSIVKGFVEIHGGTIEAYNRPEGGARFVIKLHVPQQLFSPHEAE
jgi:two-component system, OmpR family, sensor histidine kinase KdpD